jgi:hypothetical protein
MEEPRAVEAHLFAWDADDGDGRGACGVTDLRDLADLRLLDAMHAMPNGAAGKIRTARLNILTGDRQYVYGRTLLTVRRDTLTGALIYGRGQ